MADDLDLTQDQIFIPKKEDVTEVTFVGGDGRVKTAVRTKSGRFGRKHRPMPSGTEIKRIGRTELMKLEADPKTGKVTKESKTKAQKIFDNMYDIATNEAAKTDAKMAMAAIGGPGSKCSDRPPARF